MNPTPIAIDEARLRMHGCIKAVTEHEVVGLQAALGRTLAADLIASQNIPSSATAAMDGYAINVEALAHGPTELAVAGTAFAGHPVALVVDLRCCVRVMTGALLPSGANAVVMQEDVELKGHLVRFSHPCMKGSHVRQIGEDTQAGSVVVARGRTLSAADLGRLASLGHSQIAVLRRLRVAFFSSGDELQSLGSSLKPGGVYDSNRQFLLAALSRDEVEVTDLGIVPDSAEAINAALNSALAQADLLITTGGASLGAADHTRRILSERGQTIFFQIAMKPGRPVGLFSIDRKESFAPALMVFCLPGSPMAMMTTYYAVVRAALQGLSGSVWGTPRKVSARLGAALPAASASRTEFITTRLRFSDKGLIAEPIARSNQRASSLDQAFDGLIEMPAGSTQLLEGDLVQVFLV